MYAGPPTAFARVQSGLAAAAADGQQGRDVTVAALNLRYRGTLWDDLLVITPLNSIVHLGAQPYFRRFS
jgi:hypothetical protein